MQGKQFLFKTEKVEDCRQGKAQTISNIEVCEKIGRFLSKTLGPYGLDKMFYGEELLVTNDGATIMENMHFTHPIGQLLTNLSASQDNEVGDGTTSVILLTAAILSNLKEFVAKEYTADEIRAVLNKCLKDCLMKLDGMKMKYTTEKLIKLVETCLNSKNVRAHKTLFAEMLVETLGGEKKWDLNVATITGGSIKDSALVNGIAFEKTFTYAGYDQQPKRLENVKIECVDIELEWKNEKENAELRIENVEEYQRMVDAEYKILHDKLDDLINAGANVVLSSKSIGDLATQYFASKGIFSAGRVGSDLKKITEAFGGKINTNTKHVILGKAELFEEKQLGNATYNYFYSEKSKVKTLLLRGPGQQVVDEVQRAVHDAICALKKALEQDGIVTGGGSVEMVMSAMCRNNFKTAEPKEKFLYKAVSMAFEKIPSQLAENFGNDALTHLQQLRQLHFEEKETFGMGISGPADMEALGVYEPLLVKKNMIKAAFCTVDTILAVGGTLINSHNMHQQ